MATYYVADGKGGSYSTDSIVKARAYCVKMIEKHPNARSWSIRKSLKTHSFVTFYGTPAGYGWSEPGKRANYIYKNGKLVTGKMRYVGIGVR